MSSEEQKKYLDDVTSNLTSENRDDIQSVAEVNKEINKESSPKLKQHKTVSAGVAALDY